MGLFGSKKGNAGTLSSFRYSPGYSDMSGGCHNSELKRNDDGNFVFVTRDREWHNEPLTVKTYTVSSERAVEFEEYIKKVNFISLSKRLKSNDFVTDYSPWNYCVVFDCSSIGGDSYDDYSISQFRIYTPADQKLIKEVNERFLALKGDLISETTEDY